VVHKPTELDRIKSGMSSYERGPRNAILKGIEESMNEYQQVPTCICEISLDAWGEGISIGILYRSYGSCII
jgi:hypothetical protein